MKCSLQERMYRLFYGRPKSLGEGLQRVVRHAGGGKNAALVESTQSGSLTAKGSHDIGRLWNIQTSGVGKRVYSNGVVIQAGDLSAGKHPDSLGGFIIPLSGNCIAVTSKSGKLVQGRQYCGYVDYNGKHHLYIEDTKDRLVGSALAKNLVEAFDALSKANK